VFTAFVARRETPFGARCDIDTVRKTYQEKLKPTPAQERARERIL
jgi:hypothetical protein